MPYNIDVGPEVLDRASNYGAGGTFLDLDNPANANGWITNIGFWFIGASTGVRAGTFYLTGGTTYKCRASALLGDFAGGTESRSVDSLGNPLALAVQVGDVIGLYWTAGSIEADNAGFAGIMWVAGEWIDVGDETAYALIADDAASFKGLGKISLAPEVPIGETPVTVAANVLLTDFNVPRQQCAWYTKGRWWVAYREFIAAGACRLRIKSSTDRVIWGGALDAMADLQDIDGAPSGHLLYNGSFSIALNKLTGEIHVVFNNHLIGGYSPVVYRMGQCNADGTITWATADLKTVLDIWSDNFAIPQCVVDSNGYPWVIARQSHPDFPSTDNRPVVSRSTTKNGDWTTPVGFPLDLEALVYDANVAGSLCTLDSGKILAFWASNDGAGLAKCRLWNGAAWEAEQSIPITSKPLQTANCAHAVKVGTGALMMWADTPGTVTVLRSCYRTSGGVLGAIKTAHTFSEGLAKSVGLSQSPPVAMWSELGAPDQEKIYGKFYNRKTDTWGQPTLLFPVEAGIYPSTVTPSLDRDGGFLLARWVKFNPQFDVRFGAFPASSGACLSNNNAKLRVMTKI